MHRSAFQDALTAYKATWASGLFPYPGYVHSDEQGILKRFTEFCTANPACFERHHQTGHCTGSALVVSSDLQRVLLTLHAKLGIWLQLGGHADGHGIMHEVAMTEAREESGLTDLRFLPYTEALTRAFNVPANIGPLLKAQPLPFDLDWHVIPENPRREEREHIHYDTRYVIVAGESAHIVQSHESLDLRWFSLSEARQVTSERSMHRQFDKLEWLALISLAND